MGIVRQVDVSDAGCVTVMLVPTFPGCLFVGMFAEEIEGRLRRLPWCTKVVVGLAPADEIWTEDRLAEPARRALAERRRLARPTSRRLRRHVPDR